MKTTRRGFLKGTTTAATALPILGASSGDDAAPVPTLAPGERVAITLVVNGTPRPVEVAPQETLAMVLRERLRLTGTKVSCEGGACGACTVDVEGAPRNACLTLAIDVDGRAITTIEGVGGDAALDPLQQAFIDADALQCGFCTPGMIMSGRAFIARWRALHGDRPATDDDVLQGMAGNLCRCGAHPHIVEAVKAVLEDRKAVPPGGHHPPHVLPRHDAREKVTGRARYALDELPANALTGVIARARVAHGEVTKIDLAPALAVPGVAAAIVLLPVDAQGRGRVRYVGQELFAVAAETPEAARRAIAAATVDVRALPHVVDPERAARAGAPLVFDDDGDVPLASEGVPMPGFLSAWNGNVRGASALARVTTSDKARALVSELPTQVRLFAKTAVQVHAALERHVAVASWEGARLTMHTSTQTVQALASDLASALDVPAADVHVVSPFTGGAFGSKAGLKPYHLAAARLARAAGRPVRVVLPFRDHLTVGGNRPATSHVLVVGGDKRTGVRAVVHEARTACGAAVGEKGADMTAGHYPWDASTIVEENVVTHAPPSCPFRAPGYPPNAFALEMAVDAFAHQVGRDPLELRIAQETRRRFRLVYRAALERSGFAGRLRDVARDRGRFARGVGVATADWPALTSPSTTVEVRAWKDGTVELRTATQELGQGPRSVLANIASDLLRVPREKIRVETGDSAFPTAPGSFGSITTTSIAPAAANAVRALARELIARGQREHGGGTASAYGLALDDGRVISHDALCALLPVEPFVVSGVRGADVDGFLLPPKILDPFAAQIPFALQKDRVSSAVLIEVEVDRRLGRVRPLRAFMALDAGRVASPITARSQVVGGVVQGIAYALFEERRLDPASGHQLSSSFETYALPGLADAPPVDVVFLDAPSPNNPVGVIGLGENATIAVAGAVGNAVFRAIGRRITSTPITPSKILEALR